MFSKSKINRTALTSWFLIALLFGLFISRYTMPLGPAWLVLILLMLPLALGKHSVLLVYLILAGFILGWYKGGLLQTENLRYQPLFYQKVSITGRATEDSYYGDKSQLQFAIENVRTASQNLPGKIQIKGYGEPMVYRHDIVTVTGKLYPARGGKQASISFSDIEVIGRSKSIIEDFRRNFVVGMENSLPEPAASLAIGLLVGQRSLLPDKVSEAFMIVGLTHIVAVSGYNLTIIVRAVRTLLKKFSRFQVLGSSLALVYLFLLITGFSPSIVRAAIVCLLSLVAWYFGRQFKPLLIILLSASLTAFWNPYYIWGDIGWYLSFLAFGGVLILAPAILGLFKTKNPSLILTVAVESLSAQLLTLPLIMFIFGRVSIVGLLANIIIVPMVPYAMMFSVIAAFAGMIAPVISAWFALPARLILNIMLGLSNWFARWPSAQIQQTLSAGNMIFLYSVITLFIIGLKKRIQSVTIAKRKLEI